MRENLPRSHLLTKVEVEEDWPAGGGVMAQVGTGRGIPTPCTQARGKETLPTMDQNSKGHAVKLKVVPIDTNVSFKGLM